MTHSDPISQLDATLETLQTLAGRLKNSSGIHQIDIDLLQQKTRELYEQILALQPGSTAVQAEEPASPATVEDQPEPQHFTSQSQEEKIIDEEEVELEEAKSEELESAQPEPQPPVEEDVRDREETEEETTEVRTETEDAVEPEEKLAEEPVTEPEEDHETVYEDVAIEQGPEQEDRQELAETQPKTTLDLFSVSSDDSLGSVLQQSNQPNLGERLEHSRVGDLREGIGINDKFQFINELFNGDMDQYNKVLDELNHFQSLQGALTYLSELSVQHDFSKTGMAFQKMKALLVKKYA